MNWRRGRKTMRNKRLNFGALSIAVLLLGGCALNPATGKKDLNLIPVSTQEEVEMGREAFGMAVQQMGGPYPDPRLAAYVSGVGRRLAAASHRPDLEYRFEVINDSVPNAFALPGGFVAINRGLLAGLENEAQLAAVLGHEVGHVTARHGVQGMQRGALFGAALSVLSAATRDSAYGGIAQQAGQLAAGLINNTYSREQERESDHLGIEYMVQAGYDPTGAVQLQEYFYSRLEGGQDPSWVTGLFRTHPFSRERLENNRRDIARTYGHSLDNPAYALGEKEFMEATARLRAAQEGYRLMNQALELKKQGRAAESLNMLLEAAIAAPDESLILTRLGMAYLDAGDRSAALRHLRSAVRLDGKYFLTRFALGYGLLQAGEATEAAAHLEKSRELLPTLVAGFYLASAWEKTGRLEQAIRLYKNVAEQDASGDLGKKAAARLLALGAK